MTTPLQATEAVFEKVRTGWTASDYTFDAEHGTPPSTAPWIRVLVLSMGSGPASHGPTGGRHVTRRAQVIAQCFAPVATADGIKAALVLADTFRTLFEGIRLATASAGALDFEAGDVRSIGVREAKWIQVNASVPFTYEATF